MLVWPASTFSTPSSRRVRMPSARAWRRDLLAGGAATVSRSIASLITSIS